MVVTFIPAVLECEAHGEDDPHEEIRYSNVGGDREAWLSDVEELTRDFREARSRRMRWRGHQKAGASGPLSLREHAEGSGNPERARWHYARAKGEIERFDRVKKCGDTDVVRSHCHDCGCVHERPTTCGASLVCVPCRNRVIKRFRLRFLRARNVALEAAGSKLRGRGAWTDKLLTFTAPHVGTVDERIEWVRRAWLLFRRWWSDHIPHYRTKSRDRGFLWDCRCRWHLVGKPCEHDGPCEETGWRRALRHECGPVAWTRVIEWTQGSDGLGHPHIHVWALCPWMPRAEVTGAWHRALLASEPPGAFAPEKLLKVDIRHRSAAQVARELIKYLTKDLEYHKDRLGRKTFALVNPRVFATVYRLFAGTRRTQSSRGFMRGSQVPRKCLDCGSTRKKSTEIVRGGAAPGIARAPPPVAMRET
jgi:hypothetical protein